MLTLIIARNKTRQFAKNWMLCFVQSLACLVLSVAMPLSVASQNPAISAAKTYRLGVGDLVRIQVHNEPDLTIETRISESGVVPYPFLGEIQAYGTTVGQLESRIRGGLAAGYLVNPEVQVFVVEHRPIYINGAVRRPGSYSYVPGLTVFKAITLAGGLDERASRSKIYLIREGDPSRRRYKVEDGTAVYPGDTLNIEESLF